MPESCNHGNPFPLSLYLESERLPLLAAVARPPVSVSVSSPLSPVQVLLLAVSVHPHQVIREVSCVAAEAVPADAVHTAHTGAAARREVPCATSAGSVGRLRQQVSELVPDVLSTAGALLHEDCAGPGAQTVPATHGAGAHVAQRHQTDGVGLLHRSWATLADIYAGTP